MVEIKLFAGEQDGDTFQRDYGKNVPTILWVESYEATAIREAREAEGEEVDTKDLPMLPYILSVLIREDGLPVEATYEFCEDLLTADYLEHDQ